MDNSGLAACVAALRVATVETGSVPPRHEVGEKRAEGNEAGGNKIHTGFGDGPDSQNGAIPLNIG
jgi:hypothetical protein